MAHPDTASPQVPACFWEDLGRVVGRMSQALAGVHHPGLMRAHEWSFETAAAVIVGKLPVLAGLLDERQLQLLKWAITQWEGVADVLPRLPRQVCHTDVNEGNTLVSSGAHARRPVCYTRSCMYVCHDTLHLCAGMMRRAAATEQACMRACCDSVHPCAHPCAHCRASMHACVLAVTVGIHARIRARTAEQACMH
eukprot:351537-Chlamydomonas_euryale.AAC.1